MPKLEPARIYSLLTYAKAFTSIAGEPNNPGIYTVAKPKMMLILNLHAFISSVNMLLGKLGASSRIQAISQARALSLL